MLAAAEKTSPSLSHIRNLETHAFAKNQAPVADWETSTRSLHVRNSEEQFILQRKSACSCQEDLTKLIPCQKIVGAQFLLTTRRLRQPGNITKANIFQLEVGNVIFGPTKAPAAARKALPKLIHVKHLVTQISLRETPAATGKISSGCQLF